MKRFILDTQTLLWWLTDNEKLGPNTRALISNSNNRVFISPVTVWELSLKKQQGHIEGLPEMHQLIEEEGFEELVIDAYHVQFASEYKCCRNEPFRSVLMAQIQTEGATLITTDHKFAHLGIRTWNARR